ncbi:MAG: DNA-protecting protein DprA [Ignavibacteriae bacterium]|nr:DNA-protecting protein DprA [Ignavibacteriota bacterium]MCB9215687.1 DNA-protecting protein DprA [Ignavibacteria bacterium]
MEAQISEQKNWQAETIAMLSIASLPGVGFWTLNRLAALGHSFSKVIESSNIEEFLDFLKLGGASNVQIGSDDWETLRARLCREGAFQDRILTERGIQVLHAAQNEFPDRLRAIKDPPYWLFAQGNLKLLNSKSIAVVGTRRPTQDGLWLAMFIVASLHSFGVCTVSGLADGIDQQVHELSLRYDLPTIAVLGSGILLDYPKSSRNLRKEIIKKGGVILSEYLPKQKFSSENFVRRNRLQSAISELVIPVEWAAKGGTAHTVRYAVEQKRHIMCLKMLDWDILRRPELNEAASMGASIFTAPSDNQAILNFIQSCLTDPLPKEEQLSISWDLSIKRQNGSKAQGADTKP